MGVADKDGNGLRQTAAQGRPVPQCENAKEPPAVAEKTRRGRERGGSYTEKRPRRDTRRVACCWLCPHLCSVHPLYSWLSVSNTRWPCARKRSCREPMFSAAAIFSSATSTSGAKGSCTATACTRAEKRRYCAGSISPPSASEWREQEKDMGRRAGMGRHEAVACGPCRPTRGAYRQNPQWPPAARPTRFSPGKAGGNTVATS